MKKFMLKVLPVAVLAVLTGCQTIKSLSALPASSDVLVQDMSAHELSAKQQVGAGVKALLRTSFSYNTQVYIAPKEVADDELPETACEEIHDIAYIALSKKARLANLDISADDYIGDREQLKTDFLACQENRAKNSDESEFDDELARLLAELAQLSGQSHEAFGDEQLTAKRQKLIHAYYLKTSKFGMVGNYQPLKGVISALPSFQYEFGQASVMVNQPFYVDIKAGDVYLWADNLALANATWLDKKLGNAWQNKWLRLPLNDGSLPNDFVKTLFKTYATAQSKAFDGLMDEMFGYVAPDEALPLYEHLDDKAKVQIGKATTVIRQTNSKDSKQAVKKAVAEHLYNEMTKAYPVLLETPTALDKKQETLTLDSRALMQSVFAKLKEVQASEEEWLEDDDAMAEAKAEAETETETETSDISAEIAHNDTVLTDDDGADVAVKEETSELDGQTLEDEMLVDEVTDDALESETGESVQAEAAKTQDIYYGLDKRGRLLWVYQEKEQALPASWLKDPVDLSVLTAFDGAVDGTIFGRLPSAVATPNHANSVNVLEYSNTLYNTLKKSDSIFLRSFLYYLTSAFEETKAEEAVDDKATTDNEAEHEHDSEHSTKTALDAVQHDDQDDTKNTQE